MLEYPISTYAGNSGSPVLRSKKDTDGNYVSIATHAYGGLRKNSGSPLAGNYGNPYDSCILAFDTTTYPAVKTANNIDYVAVPYQTVAEFSFQDAFKVIVGFGTVAADALSSVAPFLGPIGPPIAAIANAGVALAGSIAKASIGSEAYSAEEDYNKFKARGIIGEAAIQTILDLSVSQYTNLGIDARLQTAYQKIGPNLYGIGPRLLPLVMQPAASIGYDAYQSLATPSTESASTKDLEAPSGTESASDSQVEDFMSKMWGDTVELAGESWFFDQLSQVIVDSLINPQTTTQNAPTGLCYLSSLASSKGIDFSLSDTDVELQSLCLRAVFGEAAIEALVQCDHASLQTEGCFDNIKKNAQKIGRQALKAADWLLPRLEPIIKQLLEGEPISTASNTGSTANDTGTSSSSTASTKTQMLQRAAMYARGSPASSSGKQTVRDWQLQQLEQQVNLDGLAFTKVRAR